MLLETTPLYGFISTGDKTAMYTLRTMNKDIISWGAEKRVLNRDHFIRILSNDKAKAETIALELCEQMGIPLKGDASFDLNEIKRQRAEEKRELIEAHERAVQEQQQREKEEFERQVAESVILFGKYIGKTAKEIHDVDVSYLFWLADQYQEDSHSLYNVSAKIAKDYIEQNDIAEPDFVGEEGENIELSLTLISKHSVESRFWSVMFRAQDEHGNVVVFFTTSKKFLALEPGERFKVSGIVREHRFTKNKKSTTINKPKLIK